MDGMCGWGTSHRDLLQCVYFIVVSCVAFRLLVEWFWSWWIVWIRKLPGSVEPGARRLSPSELMGSFPLPLRVAWGLAWVDVPRKEGL